MSICVCECEVDRVRVENVKASHTRTHQYLSLFSSDASRADAAGHAFTTAGPLSLSTAGAAPSCPLTEQWSAQPLMYVPLRARSSAGPQYGAQHRESARTSTARRSPRPATRNAKPAVPKQPAIISKRTHKCRYTVCDREGSVQISVSINLHILVREYSGVFEL